MHQRPDGPKRNRQVPYLQASEGYLLYVSVSKSAHFFRGRVALMMGAYAACPQAWPGFHLNSKSIALSKQSMSWFMERPSKCGHTAAAFLSKGFLPQECSHSFLRLEPG